MRKIKAVGIVLGIYAFALIVDVAMAVNSPDYQGGVTIVVILCMLALMAPKVGYRWFDCLFAMIPIYGIIFIFRIAHRIAFLPNRDWPEREIKN